MNPRKANVLLRDNGFGEGKTTSEIEARLKQYVREDKEEALRQMARIHPDKELLVGDGVNRELLNYTGRDTHRNYMGEQFLQKTLTQPHITALNRLKIHIDPLPPISSTMPLVLVKNNSLRINQMLHLRMR